MAVSRNCWNGRFAWTAGLLALPSLLALAAGCQMTDLRPSTEIDMPRKLPQPAGLSEARASESGSGEARASESGSGEARASESGSGEARSGRELASPRTQAPAGGSLAEVGDGSRNLAQLKQAAFNSSRGAQAEVQPVAASSAARDSKTEKSLDVAMAPRNTPHNPVLTAAVPSDPPLPQPLGGSQADPLDTVYRRSFDWFQNTDSFTCRMIRREVVGGKKQPEELLSFQYLKNPYSIHLKWLGSVGKGRELIYVEGKYDNKIQIRLAGGEIPFMPAGKRMSFSLDNLTVRSSSRHGVQEASFGFMLSTIGTMIAQQKQGNSKLGTVQYAGNIFRQELGVQVEMIEVKIFPGTEDGLPHGGRRLIGFDPKEGMPMLVQTFDENGQEVEFYRYDLFICKGLDQIDFDPDVLWAKPEVAAKTK